MAYATTRRKVLAGLACSGLSLSSNATFTEPSGADRPKRSSDTTFLEIIRTPDAATAFFGLVQPLSLGRVPSGWANSLVSIRTQPGRQDLPVYVSARRNGLTHIHLRWNAEVAGSLLVLGDHWERSYGDLHWRFLVPERVMPWYFMTCESEVIHGYGVKTGTGALCFWQLDPDGVSLWLNVSNGGSGVALGDRELLGATLVTRRGIAGEDPAIAAQAFCAKMCDSPRSAASVIYGSNDWYYAYGKNSAEQIVRDAELMASVAPAGGDRPFTVIDDGWTNKEAFPDMAVVAQNIRERGVRPGIWLRPLQAPTGARNELLLPNQRFRANRGVAPAYDPTIPEALELVIGKVKEATSWGYELVKHDYTTFELFGQWGFEMKAQPALPGWNFHDRTKTSAEIVRGLYESIRHAAGDRIILIGCNTVGHLAAGLFEVQRTGDDTSGQNWERTRRMGVNTLAYRLGQHHTFFLMDADCVPITTATPWALNSQWLDLVARSGTVLFVSPEPQAIGQDQRQALKEAFAIATSEPSGAHPMDWQTTSTPSHWEFRDFRSGRRVERKYHWFQGGGAWPYDV
jgi:alpha-galactosidase